MPMFCFEFVINILNSAITRLDWIIRRSYGPGIGDTRFSPVEDFYNRLAKNFQNINTKILRPVLG